MGSAISKAGYAARKSSEIDKQIAEERKIYRRDVQVLILGTPGSGKRTLMKQIKFIYQHGFSDVDLAIYRSVIYENTIDSAQSIVRYMQKAGLECRDPKNQVLIQLILDYQLAPHPKRPSASLDFPLKIAGAIHAILRDPVTLQVINAHLDEFYLMDGALYFLENVLRIAQPKYIPSELDVMRCKQQFTGTMETRVTLGQLSMRVINIGNARNKWKKWIHFFEDVTCLLFCVALSDYDQVMLEDKSQNRFMEAMGLFESVVTSRWFRRSSFVLLLRTDNFKQKLEKAPLEHYFPDYTGGSDFNRAVKHILWRFMQANQTNRSIYPHVSQISDTSNVQPIFTAIKETILRDALDASRVCNLS